MTEERINRRLAAVLAADAEDFADGEADEAGTLAALKSAPGSHLLFGSRCQ